MRSSSVHSRPSARHLLRLALSCALVLVLQDASLSRIGLAVKAQSAETVVPCRPRDGHDHYRIQHALTVDPSSPHVVWVGIEYKGIYKSVDGGATWTRADTGITGYGIESDPSDGCIQEVGTILVDPTDSQRVLMARLDSPGTLAMPISEHGGVWETRDGGASCCRAT